ncbi:hypothetical protein [Streptomyces sp. GQFP]|uniref:hypothetical protein n=1 Tax=Streptomyces sp. GQFP TaxID=2907545 RepID=UPI001F485503|nr:hypothetical protein [Streptomyces sp. GQFP]UIX34289.1 hypothetical protein LUX31_32165 [Streptomyces sp. GQFP]
MAPSVLEVPSGAHEFVPIPVQREAAAMAERTGAEPFIEHKSTSVIHVSHTNGRLRVEVAFRRGSRGWQQSGGRLLKDGKPQECMDVWARYNELAESLPPTADGPAQLPVLPPLGEDEFPTEIQHSLALLRQRLCGRSDVAVHVGQDDKGRYILVMASPNATVHMVFETQRRHGRKGAKPAGTDPIRVVTADGRDLTDEANGKLKKALSQLLAAPPGSGGGADAGGAQEAQAGGPSSRKGTVLRL